MFKVLQWRWTLMSQTVPLKEKFSKDSQEECVPKNQNQLAPLPHFQLPLIQTWIYYASQTFSVEVGCEPSLCSFNPPPPPFFPLLFSSSSLFYTFLPPQKKNNNNRISFCPVSLIPLYFRVKGSESEVAQSCPTLSDPMDYSPPGPPSMGFSRQEYWSGMPLPSFSVKTS